MPGIALSGAFGACGPPRSVRHQTGSVKGPLFLYVCRNYLEIIYIVITCSFCYIYIYESRNLFWFKI